MKQSKYVVVCIVSLERVVEGQVMCNFVLQANTSLRYILVKLV